MLVTEILGRYRVQPGSMIALTNLATDDAIAAIRAALPRPALGTRRRALTSSTVDRIDTADHDASTERHDAGDLDAISLLPSLRDGQLDVSPCVLEHEGRRAAEISLSEQQRRIDAAGRRGWWTGDHHKARRDPGQCRRRPSSRRSSAVDSHPPTSRREVQRRGGRILEALCDRARLGPFRARTRRARLRRSERDPLPPVGRATPAPRQPRHLRTRPRHRAECHRTTWRPSRPSPGPPSTPRCTRSANASRTSADNATSGSGFESCRSNSSG